MCIRDSDNCDDPLIWERKYEVDSLCYAIKLCYDFYKVTGRRSHFDGTFFEGAKKILDVYKRQGTFPQRETTAGSFEICFIREDFK